MQTTGGSALAQGYLNHLKGKDDLVTTRVETRAGFVTFALEKNRRSTRYIDNARALKAAASAAKTPNDLLKMQNIRTSLLAAAGLSDKAMKHLEESDKEKAIAELIKNFLDPAGSDFINELVYRYLLILGDSLGGSMRNLVGALAQQKLTRAVLAALNVRGITYKWMDCDNKKIVWLDKPEDEYDIEIRLKGISWTVNGKNRTLVYNLTVPLIKNNIDICLIDCSAIEYLSQKDLVKTNDRYLLLGELKGGIDPAGADEHWKTANSALDRIRIKFLEQNLLPKIIFIGAAIENKMATEIWDQLQADKLSNAANLTIDDQVSSICNWLVNV